MKNRKTITFTIILTTLISHSLLAQRGRGNGNGQAQGPFIDMSEVKSNFSPLPNSHIDKVKFKDLISLGEKLYFEKRLSVNNQMSCNTCHQVDNFGVDNEATSPGHEGKRGDRGL